MVDFINSINRNDKMKLKSAYEQVAQQAGTYPGFWSMKKLGVFPLPPDGMLVYGRVIPSTRYSKVIIIQTIVEEETR